MLRLTIGIGLLASALLWLALPSCRSSATTTGNNSGQSSGTPIRTAEEARQCFEAHWDRWLEAELRQRHSARMPVEGGETIARSGIQAERKNRLECVARLRAELAGTAGADTSVVCYRNHGGWNGVQECWEVRAQNFYQSQFVSLIDPRNGKVLLVWYLAEG